MHCTMDSGVQAFEPENSQPRSTYENARFPDKII